MTDTTPVKIVIDLSKPEGERESIVPLTAEEIAQREADALAALKASAKAKLIAGQPLSAEEAATIVL